LPQVSVLKVLLRSFVVIARDPHFDSRVSGVGFGPVSCFALTGGLIACWQGGTSANALALGRLAGQEERLDQLAFAADGHPGEPFVPGSLRDLRLAVEPGGEQLELLGVYATLVDAVQKVLE